MKDSAYYLDWYTQHLHIPNDGSLSIEEIPSGHNWEELFTSGFQVCTKCSQRIYIVRTEEYKLAWKVYAPFRSIPIIPCSTMVMRRALL